MEKMSEKPIEKCCICTHPLELSALVLPDGLTSPLQNRCGSPVCNGHRDPTEMQRHRERLAKALERTIRKEQEVAAKPKPQTTKGGEKK